MLLLAKVILRLGEKWCTLWLVLPSEILLESYILDDLFIADIRSNTGTVKF
jgi:hypothetical protein